MLKKYQKLLNKYFYRQNFFERHYFIITILVSFFVFKILWAIVSSYNDPELQKKAIKDSVKTITYIGNRGKIFDRNGNILSGNILISTVSLNPPTHLNAVNFNDVSSIWRISKKCKEGDIELKNKCKYKNLALRAKRLFKLKLLEDDFVKSVDFPQLVAQALEDKNNSILNTILSKKTACVNIGKKNKKFTPKCSKYKMLKKNLPFTGNIVQNLLALKKEKFLVCEVSKFKISTKDKIFSTLSFWKDKINPKTQNIKCAVRRIKGIAIDNSTKRFYPQAQGTTPLIGAVNNKKVGVFGLENSFNSLLQPKSITIKLTKDNGSWISKYGQDRQKIKNLNGNDLHLTIDKDIQFHLFNAIRKSVKKSGAISGGGIILNPRGEIMAMASYPSSDANKGINGVDDYAHYINRPIKDNLDIASIIKPLIALIALEERVITFDEKIDISTGEGIKKFKVDKKRPYISIQDIIKESHGLGAIKIGKKITDEVMYNYLSRLKFGSSPGVLPTIESAGLLRNFYNWAKSDKKRVSFGGYGVISTTLVQIARSYLIFLNDGKISNIKLFKNGIDYSQKIFSKKNINYITQALINGVNQDGTGKRAKLKNIIAAGKTGTSQLLINGKYSNSKHNTLFAGFAPAKNPKFLMVVNIKSPKGYYNNGGSIAAPVFKKVMEKILPATNNH